MAGVNGHSIFPRCGHRKFPYPLLVLDPQPRNGQRRQLGDRLKGVGVEHLHAIAPVETLDLGILVGLARLDVLNRQPVVWKVSVTVVALVRFMPLRIDLDCHRRSQRISQSGHVRLTLPPLPLVILCPR